MNETILFDKNSVKTNANDDRDHLINLTSTITNYDKVTKNFDQFFNNPFFFIEFTKLRVAIHLDEKQKKEIFSS